MQSETKYGKILFHSELTSKAALARIAIFFILSSIFIGLAIFTILSMESDTDVRGAWGVLFGLASIPFVSRIFASRASKATVFENGLMHSRGSKVTDLAFEDIAGIRDLTDKTIFLALIIPVFASKSRIITIHKKDGKIIEINKNQARYFNDFADTFNFAFTEHLLNGITKENIYQANISFGAQLELSNGQLKYDSWGKEGEKIIPLDLVFGLQPNENGNLIMLMGEKNEKGKAEILASIKADVALNIGALYRILEILR